jgi:hypothetical protein
LAEITFIEERLEWTFSSMNEFETRLLGPLNWLNNSEIYYECKLSPSYIQIYCKHCNLFKVWYNYKRNGNGGFTDIKLSRKVNMGHIRAKHTEAHIKKAESMKASLKYLQLQEPPSDQHFGHANSST